MTIRSLVRAALVLSSACGFGAAPVRAGHRPRGRAGGGRATGRPRRGRDRRGRGDRSQHGDGGGRSVRPRPRARRARLAAGPDDRIRPQGRDRRAWCPRAGSVAQDIALSAEVVQLAEIAVSAEAERGTVNRALDEQRNATNIVSSITAEQIQKSPDGDAGQAVQRVSGVTVQDGTLRLRARPGRALHHHFAQRRAHPEPRARAEGGAARPLPLQPAGGHHDLQDVHPRPARRLQRRVGEPQDPRVPGAPGGHVLRSRAGSTPRRRARIWCARRSRGRSGSASRARSGSFRRAGTPPATFAGSTSRRSTTIIGSFRNAWSPPVGRRLRQRRVRTHLRGRGSDLRASPIGYIGSFTYSYGQEVRAEEPRSLIIGEWRRASSRSTSRRGPPSRNSVLWGGILNLSTRLGTSSKIAFNNTYNRSADNEAIRARGRERGVQRRPRRHPAHLHRADRALPPAHRRAPARRAITWWTGR